MFLPHNKEEVNINILVYVKPQSALALLLPITSGQGTVSEVGISSNVFLGRCLSDIIVLINYNLIVEWR